MARFKDCEGKEWDVRILTGHLRPLREEFGIDLRDALKPEENSLAEALGDPEKFGQVLWVLVQPQAEAAGITPEAFAFRFDGEALESAGTALFKAVWDFFRPRTGEKAEAAFRESLEKQTAAVNAGLDQVRRSLTSNGSAGSSAAPAASTPAPSPSAS